MVGLLLGVSGLLVGGEMIDCCGELARLRGRRRCLGQKSKVGEPLTAGFESWRTEVWSSPRVQALGAQFFPRLRSGNEVIIKSHELKEFERECMLLRENLDAICAEVDLSGQHGLAVGNGPGQVVTASASTEVFRDLVSQRLASIEDAIRRAAHAGGDVVIW